MLDKDTPLAYTPLMDNFYHDMLEIQMMRRLARDANEVLRACLRLDNQYYVGYPNEPELTDEFLREMGVVTE